MKSKQTIATLPEGSIFGELTFLIDEPITATIVGGSKGRTIIRRLTETHLQEVFRTYRGLAGRYYEFLCYVLINRLHRLAVHIAQYHQKHTFDAEEVMNETFAEMRMSMAMQPEGGGEPDVDDSSG